MVKSYSNIKVVFHKIEKIVGKEENAGNQHFLLFPQCFPLLHQKSSLYGKGLIIYGLLHKPSF